MFSLFNNVLANSQFSKIAFCVIGPTTRFQANYHVRWRGDGPYLGFIIYDINSRKNIYIYDINYYIIL